MEKIDIAQEISRLQKTALLIVDAQYDFMPGGSLAVPGGDKIIPVVNKLRDGVAWDFVVLSQDWHPSNHSSFAVNNDNAAPFSVKKLASGEDQVMWPVHCVQGSRGAEIHSEILREGDVVVRKGIDPEVDSYSAFFDNDKKRETELNRLFKERGIEVVVVVGLATDYCVSFTANHAIDLGYKTFLVLNGCAGIDEDGCKKAIEGLSARGAKIAFLADA